jgi:CHAD domain-containing protein
MQTIHADKWIEEIRPDDGTVAVAVLTLRNRLEAVQHFLPLAAYEADQEVEYVHQLRVWSRRAAAALKVYAEFLPRQRATWVTKQLKRIRRAANDVQNCDVQIMRLSQDEPDEAASWIEKLRAERAQVQMPLMAICDKPEDSDRFRRRCTKLLDRVRIRTKETGKSPYARFADWARIGFQPVDERFFEAVPSDDADEKRLHLFRIRGKKLRYVMELLAPAFPLKPGKTYAP